MTSMFKWVANKFSQASNSAAEILLRKIISRFLEEPIQDNTFSLQLFEDWSLRFELKKSFLSVSLVNPYSPFVCFKSIYFSSVKFDAAYNLSKLYLIIDRIVLDVTTKDPNIDSKPDPDLDASIHQFTEQLPIENKNSSLSDWIINKVQTIKFKIENFTTVFHIGIDQNPLTLVFQKFEISYDSKPTITFSILIPSLTVFIGQRRNQKEIFTLIGMKSSYKPQVLSLKIDKIYINVDLPLIDNLTSFIVSLPPNHNRPNTKKGSNSFPPFCIEFLISNLFIAVSNLSIEMHDLELIYSQNEMNVKLSNFTICCCGNQILRFNGETPFTMKLTNPDILTPLSSFQDFPQDFLQATQYHLSNHLNSIIINVLINGILINFTSDFMKEIVNLSQWAFNNQLFNKEPTTLPKKSSLFLTLSLKVIEVRIGCLGLSLTENIIRLYQSLTPTSSAQNIIYQAGSVSLVDHTNIPFLQCIKPISEQNTFLSILFSLKESLTSHPMISFYGNISNLLVRNPFSIEKIIDSIKIFQESIPSSANSTQASESKIIDINGQFTLSSLTLDYTSLNMPARLIMSLPTFQVSIASINDINLLFSLSSFITNSRQTYPLESLFPPIKYSDIGLAPIFHIESSTIKINRHSSQTFITIDSIILNGGLCFDSLSLFLALIPHLQYGMDFPSTMRPSTRHFDLPTQLFDIENTLSNTLTQSFNLGPLNSVPIKPITNIPVIDSIDSLLNTSFTQTEEFESISGPSNDNITGYGDPSTKSSLILSIQSFQIKFSIFGGRDFDAIYDLLPISHPLFMTNDPIDVEFEKISLRNEEVYIELSLSGNIDFQSYPKDPMLSNRIQIALNDLSLLDCIPTSPSKVLFGIEQTGIVTVCVDILKTNSPRLELSIKANLPDIVVFLTQEQIDFFTEISSIAIPHFDAQDIIDEPLAFHYFELIPSHVRVYAHFRYCMDIHIDDVVFEIPACHLLACRGGDELAGSLAEFYIAEMLRPGTAAVLSGLPIIKNFRHIIGAVKDIFSFDTRRFGYGVGIAKGIGTLFQVLAMETFNAGANVATFAERLLSVTLDIASGNNDKHENRKSIATLILKNGSSLSVGNVIRSVPTLIISPGILGLQKFRELFRLMRDRVSPEYTKQNIYKKIR